MSFELHSVDITVSPDDHCEPLGLLILRDADSEQRFELKPGLSHVEFFNTFSQALQAAAQQGRSPEVLTVPRGSHGTAIPFSWMCLSGKGNFSKGVQGHEWHLWVHDGQLALSFEHGAYGERRERPSTLADAFVRLAQLVQGSVTWRQFGDLESRRTLLEKGQFYWQDPKSGEDVPVDNFVFRTADGFELRQSGVSHRAVLGLAQAGQRGGHEWFDDHAEALRRLADILSGRVDLTLFGSRASPGRYEQAPGRLPEAVKPCRLAQGQFFVESIYQSQDVHPAPVLTFRTGEGVEARLQVAADVWRVRGRKPRQAWRIARFAPGKAHQALELWAQVLQNGLSALKGFEAGS